MNRPKVHIPHNYGGPISADALADLALTIGTLLEEATGGSSALRHIYVSPSADSSVAGVYLADGKPIKVRGFRRKVRPGSMVIAWNTALALSRLSQGCVVPGWDGPPPEGNVFDAALRLRVFVHETLHSIGSSKRRTALHPQSTINPGYRVWIEGLTDAATDMVMGPLTHRLGLDQLDPRFDHCVSRARNMTAYCGYASAVRRIAVASARVSDVPMSEVILQAVGCGDPAAAITTVAHPGQAPTPQASAEAVAALQRLVPIWDHWQKVDSPRRLRSAGIRAGWATAERLGVKSLG